MGLVGGEVDKLVETKGKYIPCCAYMLISPWPMLMSAITIGLNEYDAIRTRERAEKGSQQMYDEHYGGQDNYDPNNYDAPQQIQNYGGRY